MKCNEQFIYIYFSSKLSIGRSAIEDDLDDILGEKGEVTGGGSGISGSNIDIEIYDGNTIDFLQPIRNFLQKIKVPEDTVVVISNKRFLVYEK